MRARLLIAWLLPAGLLLAAPAFAQFTVSGAGSGGTTASGCPSAGCWPPAI